MDMSKEFINLCRRRFCSHATTETKPSGEYCYHPFLGEIEGTLKVCTKCGKEVINEK